METRINPHTFSIRLFQSFLLGTTLLFLLVPSFKLMPDRGANQERVFLSKSNNWFIRQRGPYLQDIPPDARRRAWEAARQSQQMDALEPAAAPAWRSIGPTGVSIQGRVTAIDVSPSNPSLVLIGADAGGIWRSTDAGSTFVPVSDDQVDLSVGWLAFAPSNPSIVYAGMGRADLGYLGSGVLKSTDAGQSWRAVSNGSLPGRGSTKKLLVDPNDSNTVYLAQNLNALVRGGGVFVSRDGGVNWSRLFTGLVQDIALHPTDARTLYTATIAFPVGSGPSSGIYRSTNSGLTWTQVLATPFDAGGTFGIYLAVTPASPNSLYVFTGGLIGGSIVPMVLLSSDRGDTWARRDAMGVDPTDFGNHEAIAVDPFNPNTVYIGTLPLYKSTDAGVTWRQLPTPHVDQHAIFVSPTNPNLIYFGNDGGLWKSTDAGATLQSLNSTLSIFEFYTLALHPTNSAISYGGTQDNGTQSKLTNSAQWQVVTGGDGGDCIIDPSNPDIVFTSLQQIQVFRTRGNGRIVEAVVATPATFGEPDSAPRVAFISPPFVGDGLHSTLYFGTWRLFVSTDLGNTWTAPGGATDLTTGGFDVLSAIGVGRSNPSVIYTGSARGRAMVSTDGGRSWSDSRNGLPAHTGFPQNFITSITVDPANSAVAYITLSGFGSPHIFKTTNTGASWTSVSGNLPDIPVNALLIDPLDRNTLFAGTDIGPFRSTDDGASWTLSNNGLPAVVVTAFSAQPSGLIQMATYGRGIYQLDRGLADFSLEVNSSSQTIPPGGSASFQLTVRPVNNFDQPVSVSAAVTPPSQTVTVSLNPATVLPERSTTLTVSTMANTPPGIYTVQITGASTTLVRSASATVTVKAGPSISSAVFAAPKKLTIEGSLFGNSPRVIINGTDRSSRAASASDTLIILKGKMKKLGLKTGDNTVQVIDATGATSNLFVLRL